MTADKIDLQPLLTTLSKISSNRVLAFCDRTSEGDLTRVQIPVRECNPGDKTDRVLRRFATDWLKRHIENVGIDARFEKLPAGTSYYTDDVTEVPVHAAITISWWPKREETDFEQLKRQQKEWKGSRPQSD